MIGQRQGESVATLGRASISVGGLPDAADRAAGRTGRGRLAPKTAMADDYVYRLTVSSDTVYLDARRGQCAPEGNSDGIPGLE